MIFVASTGDDGLPADTGTRLTGFTELAATAITNAEARTALIASRVRIVASADATRRRIERDLHDGAAAAGSPPGAPAGRAGGRPARGRGAGGRGR
jgi:hypothetical protein